MDDKLIMTQKHRRSNNSLHYVGILLFFLFKSLTTDPENFLAGSKASHEKLLFLQSSQCMQFTTVDEKKVQLSSVLLHRRYCILSKIQTASEVSSIWEENWTICLIMRITRNKLNYLLPIKILYHITHVLKMISTFRSNSTICNTTCSHH